MVTLDDVANALNLKPEEDIKGFAVYGQVKSINPDGTYQVSLNGSTTTTKCARLTGAHVDDVVLVTVLNNGYAVVTGCVGGDTDALEALEQSGATMQHFWYDANGAHVTEDTQEDYQQDPSSAGGNTLITSQGMAVRKGTKELATMSKDGFDAKTYDSSDNEVVIAHLGYGPGTNDSGGTSNAPYYDIGVRLSGSTKGNYSTVEGHDNTASGYDSHAEGGVNIASGTDSHCEGARNTASGHYSHCEGVLNTASGVNSHCEGYQSEASGNFSHAGGEQTIAGYDHQTVIGKYNDNKSGDLFEIGNGTGNFARSNAFEVDNSGNVTAAGGIRSPLEPPTPSITATKGTLVATQARRFGQVVQLWIQYRNTSSTAGGQNVFEGTLNTTALRPVMSSSGTGYFGEHAMVGFLTTAGAITIRNAASTAVTIPSTSTSSLAITYLVN